MVLGSSPVAVIEIIYCEIFGVELVPKEIERFIRYKNIKTNIFRVQSNNSIILRYFCIGFIDFRFAGKTLIDLISFFSPYDFEKNDSIILSYFKTSKIINSYLRDQRKFRLNEINKIKYYFHSEIQERKIMSK